MQPFHPIADSTVSISASTSSSRVALQKTPSTGEFHLRIHNAGAATIFFNRGGSTIDATTSNMPIPAGAVEVITINNAQKEPVTHVAAITASGTATVYFTVGWGL